MLYQSECTRHHWTSKGDGCGYWHGPRADTIMHGPRMPTSPASWEMPPNRTILSKSFRSHEGKMVPIESIGREQPWAHRGLKGCQDQLNAIHIAARKDSLPGSPDGFTWRLNHGTVGGERFGKVDPTPAGYRNAPRCAKSP